MTLQSLVETYGYWIVLAGSFLEGETILILAGFAAHRGYLSFTLVVMTAFAGSFLGDQLYFFLGRRYGPRLTGLRPTWQARTQKATALLERFQTPFILANRFLYGLRIAGPIAIGMSRVSASRFAVLNLVSALVWAVVIGAAGYLFGEAVERILMDIRKVEEILFAFLAIAGILGWAIYRWHTRRHSR